MVEDMEGLVPLYVGKRDLSLLATFIYGVDIGAEFDPPFPASFQGYLSRKYDAIENVGHPLVWEAILEIVANNQDKDPIDLFFEEYYAYREDVENA